MPRRKLVKGDRVKIIGLWKVSNPDPNRNCGRAYIGNYATVIDDLGCVDTKMGIRIHIDNEEGIWHWCRKNLRALPRK